MKTFVILFALMAMAAAQGSVNFVDEADNSQQDSAENRLTVTNNGCGVTVHPHDGQGSGSVIQIGSSQGCGNVMFVDNNNPGGVQFVDNSRPHDNGVIVNPDPFFGQPSGPAAIDISPAFVDPRPNYPYPYRPTNNGARSG
ncbi:uncharacterized protein LOC115447569 isoform X8 [Manduca sexta]|uniref:uncharacterized protein LOC115447569 isoform X8 n=1 Tax=Manduca sexta TaxID=7130 RepID=UPI00188EC1DE|nr:uncharacterized protein LOC115447569 isoform X8 [Manduca sexta]